MVITTDGQIARIVVKLQPKVFFLTKKATRRSSFRHQKQLAQNLKRIAGIALI
jgi:hypothetical protein